MDLVERVAKAIKQALLDDAETDAYMRAEDDVDDFCIDGNIRLTPVARAAIAEVLDAMREPSWDMALAGVKGYQTGDPQEKFAGSGIGMKDAWRSMLEQFRKEAGICK